MTNLIIRNDLKNHLIKHILIFKSEQNKFNNLFENGWTKYDVESIKISRNEKIDALIVSFAKKKYRIGNGGIDNNESIYI